MPYHQNRVQNSGYRKLRRMATLVNVPDSDQFTISAWVRSPAATGLYNNTSALLQASDRVANHGRFNFRFYRNTRLWTFRVNEEPTGTSYWEMVNPTLTMPDPDAWYYLKLILDLTAPEGQEFSLTINDQTELLAAYGIGGSTPGTIPLSLCNEWYVCGTDHNVTPWEGGIADLVFSPTVLTHPSLAYNGGVPLDISGVAAPIKLYEQNAASFSGNTANANGASLVFEDAAGVSGGGGGWSDV